MNDILQERFAPRLKRFEHRLEARLPAADDPPESLNAAMRYAALGGGKRIRPLLVYAAAEALGLAEDKVDAVAVAVELIHAYSLIHDDLPAMDDDDLRRGRATVHKVYDEATAILAGDALQALAFEILADAPPMAHNAGAQVRVIRGLAAACGARGMAGGQAQDLAAVGRQLDRSQLEAMHRLKTGALIRFAVVAPAWLCEADGARRAALHRYGSLVGLAFQIHDDVLDETGDVTELGKHPDADRNRNKPTFPSVLGLDASRELAERLDQQALDCLEPFGPPGESLAELARYAVDRRR